VRGKPNEESLLGRTQNLQNQHLAIPVGAFGVAHLVKEFFGAAFLVLYSEDLHERSKDQIYFILLGRL
jgi:mannose-6-phosphate isomerase-like protein (cupin superfamily)